MHHRVSHRAKKQRTSPYTGQPQEIFNNTREIHSTPRATTGIEPALLPSADTFYLENFFYLREFFSNNHLFRATGGGDKFKYDVIVVQIFFSSKTTGTGFKIRNQIIYHTFQMLNPLFKIYFSYFGFYSILLHCLLFFVIYYFSFKLILFCFQSDFIFKKVYFSIA